LPAEGVPGLAKTLMISTLADAESEFQPHPVHARSDAADITGPT